jgi:hypothetical protein
MKLIDLKLRNLNKKQLLKIIEFYFRLNKASVFFYFYLIEMAFNATMHRDKTLTSMQNLLKITREYTHNYVILL